MGQTQLSVGDVVQHRILGSEKVIVGVGADRYLCVSQEDIGRDGRLRPKARVALHRAESLRKIEHREDVVPVQLDRLAEKEFKQTHRLRIEAIFFKAVEEKKVEALEKAMQGR